MSAETKKPEEKPKKPLETPSKEKRTEETPKKAEAKPVETKPKEEKPKEEKPAKPKFEVTDFNPWSVLKYPHLAEKSMNMVEMENKLVFVADRKAKKAQIKEAIERGFNVKVEAVNIEITRKGTKKVYAKLHPDSDATDIASRLGML